MMPRVCTVEIRFRADCREIRQPGYCSKQCWDCGRDWLGKNREHQFGMVWRPLLKSI